MGAIDRGTRGRWARSRSGLVMAACAAAFAQAWAAERAAEAVLLAEASMPRPRLSLASPAPLPSQALQAGQDVGLSLRQALSATQSIDVTAWRRAPQPDAMSLVQQRDPFYGARVEMQLAPSRGVATDLKAIGMQLDNGAKLMLRRRNGGPTLYYRSQF